MKYHQKDIVEIDFPIPGEGYKVHPALIVSNDELSLNRSFGSVNSTERNIIMARLIAETPVLSGSDARRLEEAISNV